MTQPPIVRAFFDPATFTASYVVHDPISKQAAIIDPVLDFTRPMHCWPMSRNRASIWSGCSKPTPTPTTCPPRTICANRPVPPW
jgi:hypothetical protein